jgi:uncharacterized protein (DUF697 family)
VSESPTPGEVRALERRGRNLLSAVERLVCEPDEIIEAVEILKYDERPDAWPSEDAFLRDVAARIISQHSTRSAIGGGLTALPAIIPGPGTLVTTVGGAMADMAWMLRQEVEMALALTYLYGYDITDERERWLAFGLASISTYDARDGRSYFTDLAEAQVEAMVKYTPRQLTKLVVTEMGKIALARAGRGFLRAVPLVGVVVGATSNKLLTTAVGWRCEAALARRRRADRALSDDVVDARVR